MTQEVRMGGGGGGRVLGCELGHLTHLEEPRARGNPACREFSHCPFLLKIVIKKDHVRRDVVKLTGLPALRGSQGPDCAVPDGSSSPSPGERDPGEGSCVLNILPVPSPTCFSLICISAQGQ